MAAPEAATAAAGGKGVSRGTTIRFTPVYGVYGAPACAQP
jgi:hypothetical protein